MSQFKLAPATRERLTVVAQQSSKASEVRRAQALVWLSAGHTYGQVACEMGVTRQTIYNWVRRYQERQERSVVERVQPGVQTGRPAKQLALAKGVIAKVWHHDPRRHGFRAAVWTVPMLRCQIHQRTGEWVSGRTVRRALRVLRYRYKRPRLVLARRQASWRQAKGGSSVG